jgi:hypothetical protein
MSQLFLDSFSGYATADLPTRYPGGSNFSGGIVTTQLPPGSQAGAHVLALGNFQGPTALSSNLGAQSRLIQGQRFYSSGDGGYIIQFCSPNSPFTNLVAGLWFDLTGIQVKNSADTTVAFGPTIPQNEWHHYEFDVNFTTGTFSVYLDGNPAPLITGTAASLVSTVVSFFAVGVGAYNGAPTHATSAHGFVADLYVFNGLGSPPFNQPLAPQGLGAAKMAFSVPSAPGIISNWTANGAATIWQCINQIPQDGDATYASDAVAGDQYQCVFSALPAMQTLISVQLSTYARTDDAGPRAYQSGFWKGGTFGYSGVNQFLGGSYNYIEDEFMVNPITGTAWTVADLTGLQFGAKLTV